MRESIIEAAGVKLARNLGWYVYKLAFPSASGAHDRIHFRAGVTFTIEYKATGKKATAKQLKRARELYEAGIVSRCIDSIDSAHRFIVNISSRAPHRVSELLDVSSFE